MRWGICICVALASCALLPRVASAGTDPTQDDEFLGKSNGVSYVVNAETYAEDGDKTSAAACPNPGGRWRLVGGGFTTDGGTASAARISASRPLDLLDLQGDDDEHQDDFWEASASATTGTVLRSYAICAKWSRLKHKVKRAPSSQTGVRSEDIACHRGLATGGGGYVGTADSYLSSLFPAAPDGWRVGLFDAERGAGVMETYIICARGRDLRVRTGERLVDPGATDGSIVTCKPDEVAVGGGGSSQGPPGSMRLVDSGPVDIGDTGNDTPEDGWVAGAYNPSGAPLLLEVFAVCAS